MSGHFGAKWDSLSPALRHAVARAGRSVALAWFVARRATTGAGAHARWSPRRDRV